MAPLLPNKALSQLPNPVTQRAAVPRCSLQAVQLAPVGLKVNEFVGNNEAVLCKKSKLHDAAVTAAVVLHDASGNREFATASLDKSVVHCSIAQDGQNIVAFTTRLSPNKGPLFSIAADPGRQSDVSHLWVGTSTKDILACCPSQKRIEKAANGHTGWVRSLAVHGRWLFSCGCNHLRQYDISRPVPKLVRDVKLFTGDILGIAAAAGRVFTCGADGSLRCWAITRKGELIEQTSVKHAHDGRVLGIHAGDGVVYTVGQDGAIKAWDQSTLECVSGLAGAHDGSRVHCVTVGPDGSVYTGGDDNLVRRWDPLMLQPVGMPLHCHQHSVRALAAGPQRSLLSGDAAGYVALWDV